MEIHTFVLPSRYSLGPFLTEVLFIDSFINVKTLICKVIFRQFTHFKDISVVWDIDSDHCIRYTSVKL